MNDAWLEPHRPLIEKALADVRSHLGMLTIESGLRGAQVKINGEPSGFLPLSGPLFLLPGAVQVEIAAPARRPWRSEVQVKPGETARLAPIFEPLDEPRVDGLLFLPARSPAGSSRRLVSIECLALGGAVVLSGGTIAVVTTWRSNAPDHETAASVSLAGRF